MTQFFQTRMGAKFFQADIPRLIEALERIAKQLEQRSQADDDADEGE